MNMLRRLIERRQLERDLSDELGQHLDEKIEALVADGVTREEAERRAHREFGNVTAIEERGREVWRWQLVEDAWADLRYATRQWRRTPAFTCAALVTLALGIGANTAVFSVVNGVVLRPLPFPSPERLVSVQSVDRRSGSPGGLSYPNFFDFRRATRTLSHIASYRNADFTLTGRGLPVHLRGEIVSWELFQALQVVPALGRAFVPADEQAGSRAVIPSYNMWATHLGGDPAVVGQAIIVDGEPHVVAGVAPAGFSFPIRHQPVEIWTTLARDAASGTRTPVTEQRGARMLDTIARLAPGASLEQARAEMDGIAARLLRQHPDNNANVPNTDVRYEIARLLGPMREGVLLLWGTVGLVFLIACANVSNLLVARTADRQREFDVRLALGGSRRRIIRQLVAENLLLGGCGSALGVAVAYVGLRLLLPLADGLPRLEEVTLDGRVLLFAALVAVATTLLVTVGPAIRLSRAGRTRPLLTTARAVADGRHRLRGAIVVAQVAVSLVLLSAATLLVSGLVELLNRDLGFKPERLMAFNFSLPGVQYDTDRRVQFYSRLMERIAGVGGVRKVAAAMPLPLSGHEIGISFSIEGRPSPSRGRPTSDMAIVSPDYFATIGTPVLEGRDFSDLDDHRHPRVLIVNRAFADKFFPGQSAIGKRIQSGATGPYDDDTPMREIVGIVGDARQSPLSRTPDPIYYMPFRQLPWGASIVVRSDVPPETLVPTLRQLASSLDGQVAVHGVKTFDQALSGGVAAPRLLVLLMGSFAGIALLLTATGLYGLLAYGVQQRTREFGVRMALGARRPTIVGVVTREALVLVAAGLAIGGLGVLAAAGVVRNRVPDIGPPLPVLLLVACGVILLTAVSAAAVPARRAAGVNPAEALRAE
jgi:predicted permease